MLFMMKSADQGRLVPKVTPTQGSNLGLQHFRQIIYHLSHQGSPRHFGILAWRIPWTEELKSQRVGHDGSDLSMQS